MKMAYIDIDPFGDNNKTDPQHDEPVDETVSLTPGEVTGGGSTWKPEHE